MDIYVLCQVTKGGIENKCAEEMVRLQKLVNCVYFLRYKWGQPFGFSNLW